MKKSEGGGKKKKKKKKKIKKVAVRAETDDAWAAGGGISGYAGEDYGADDYGDYGADDYGDYGADGGAASAVAEDPFGGFM